MRPKRGFTLIELLVVIAIIAVLAAILFPVFARARSAAKASNCQSNLKQVGNAIKMYLTDWQDTYPTNRTIQGNGVVGPIMPSVDLSQPDPIPPSTDPPKFQHGINWVEALYSYVESITKKGDPQSSWRCQAASNAEYPATGNNCGVTISFNRNLIEQPEGILKGAANLMMCREFDRLTIAMLRPMNDSTGQSGVKPQYAFLDMKDGSMGTTQWKMHGNGSHVLFADGHVKIFDLSYFPEYANMSQVANWDATTQQWYNFVYPNPINPDQKAKDRSIAISP